MAKDQFSISYLTPMVNISRIALFCSHPKRIISPLRKKTTKILVSTRIWWGKTWKWALFSELSLNFDSPITLIFTPVTNLLLNMLIVSITGKFTSNIKGPSNILSHNRCYRLQPLLSALILMLTHFIDWNWT